MGNSVLDVSVIDTATTVAAAGAIVAAAAAAQGGNLASMSGMTPGQVPSGLPQPGAGIIHADVI
jgi:hypothetical protein